jgi:hypothetical protein
LLSHAPPDYVRSLTLVLTCHDFPDWLAPHQIDETIRRVASEYGIEALVEVRERFIVAYLRRPNRSPGQLDAESSPEFRSRRQVNPGPSSLAMVDGRGIAGTVVQSGGRSISALVATLLGR